MPTFADMLDSEQLSGLAALVTQIAVPAMPDPNTMVDAVCNDCSTDLLVADPIAGAVIVCSDCGTKRVQGKAGRRYVKIPRTEVPPEGGADAAGVDLSKISDSQIGAAMREGALRLTAARMMNARRGRLTAEQERQVTSLIGNLPLTREQALMVVLRNKP